MKKAGKKKKLNQLRKILLLHLINSLKRQQSLKETAIVPLIRHTLIQSLNMGIKLNMQCLPKLRKFKRILG